MEKLYKVELPYSELLKLDGTSSVKVQEVIQQAKAENDIGFDLPVMNEIIVKSMKIGTLKWSFKTIRNCNYCDKTYGYHKYPRDGRHHRKGDSNHDKPMYYSGIAFNEGFVTFAGYGDMCRECAEKHKVIDRLCDYIVNNDLPIELVQRKEQTKYKKDNIRICYECGNEMQESKMERMPCITSGTYPSVCPNCGAKQLVFGKSHKTTDKFVMLPVV